MAADFFMDAAALTAAGQRIRGTGTTLGAALNQLGAVLDDHDGCWGTDEVGEAFAKSYVGPAGETRGYGGMTVDGHVELAGDVDKARTAFQGVDRENAQRMDRGTTT